MFLLAAADAATVDTVLINWHSFFFLLFALLACAFAVGVVVSSNVVHMAFFLTISLGATAGLFILAGAEFLGAMQLMIYVGGTLVLLVFGVMLTAQSRFVSMKTSGSEWVIAAVVGSALLAVLVQAAVSVPSWRSPQANVSDFERANELRKLEKQRLEEETRAKEKEEALKKGVPYREKLLSESEKSDLAAKERAEEIAFRIRFDRDTAKRAPLDEPNNASELGLGLLGMRPDKNEKQQPDEDLRGGLSGYLLPFEIISIHLVVVLIGAAYLARTKRRKDASEEGTGTTGA